MDTQVTASTQHCAYCGLSIDTPSAPERFGERFCSDAHAEQFATGVRTARMELAAQTGTPAGACALPPAGERRWTDYAKRAACWGAPMLMLLALPLLWSGGWAATGGSLLSVAALLACPLAMYFMMRGMMTMQHPPTSAEKRSEKEPPHA